MFYILTILIGYLVGCSNLAFFISKAKGVDIRAHGSANLGTANATITLGWRMGILVGIHDIGKAVLAVLLAELLFPALPHVGAVAGVACVLGHIFPFYLKFKGGKGLASFLGMTLALNWKFALIVLAVVALVMLITDYLVLGTVAAVVMVPLWLGIAGQSLILGLILFAASAVILFKHRDNYIRILRGTEIGLRRTLTKKDRVSKK